MWLASGETVAPELILSDWREHFSEIVGIRKGRKQFYFSRTKEMLSTRAGIVNSMYNEQSIRNRSAGIGVCMRELMMPANSRVPRY